VLSVKPVKQSLWTFDTSNTGGLGVEFFAAEGGAIYLKDKIGTPATFKYVAAGAGLSYGLKLPKIGKIKIDGKSVSAALGPKAFPNTGTIFVLPGCPGTDLTRNDIKGVCAFVEVAGGVLFGGSATAMLLGMNALWLAAVVAAIGESIVAPPLQLAAMMAWDKMVQTSKGLLLMAGATAGLQAGIGGAAYIGGLI
jgi:hypothetical protein